jgi:WD40 repeat protein
MPASAAPLSVESPYVGLTHYTEESADWFFGRDAQIAVIIGNLRAARLTLLYAESGVGKSSLLRAGVAARLRSLADHDAQTRGSPRLVPVVFSSWTDQPLAALIEAIEEAILPYLGEGATVELPRDRLDEAIKTAAGAVDATLLLILDQFEEYFLYRPEEEGEAGFADQLAGCVNRSDLRANYMVSIREDAYARVGDLFRGRIANVYGNFLHLDYLDTDEARQAITKPIERVNELHPETDPYEIEPAVVDAVLEQVRRSRFAAGGNGRAPADLEPGEEQGAPIETTYLQLVMRRLWDEETEAGSHVLRMETLERLGGPHTMIGTHLDRSMGALSPKEQTAAASVFRFLVTRAGTKIALTAKDLSELSELSESDVDPVLRRLSAGDLHILRPVAPRDGHGEVSYEIFHDALARPIVNWRARKEQEELEQGRVEKERAQRAAIEAERREARERNRKRLALAGLGACLVALLATAIVFAVVQSNLADERRKASESVAAAARISQLSRSPTFGPSAAALASIEAYRLSPTFEARNQTLAALQLNAGVPKIAVGHERAVTAVAFWPNSAKVASGGADQTVRLWNADGRKLGRPLLTGSAIRSVAVSPPSEGQTRTLAAALEDGRIDVWDITDPRDAEHLRSLRVTSGRGVNTVAFSPERPNLLAAGDDGGHITLWDLADSPPPVKLATREALGRVNALAYAPSGRTLASASAGGGQTWKISGSGFSPQGPRTRVKGAHSSVALASGSLAFGSGDRISLFSPDGRKQVLRTRGVSSLAFADRGSVLVSGSRDWNVTTWDVKTGRPVGPSRVHEHGVEAVAVSPDGNTIASAGHDKFVKLWPLEPDGALARTVGGFRLGKAGSRRAFIADLAANSQSQLAAAGGTAGASIWSLDPAGTERPTQVPSFHDRRLSYAVAYNKDDVLVAADGQSFSVWDTSLESCTKMPREPCLLGRPTGDSLRRARIRSPIRSLAFFESGGSTLVASGGDDGRLHLWDVPEAGAPTHLWRSPDRVPNGIKDLAYLASNQEDPLLAVAGGDGTIRIWNVADLNHPSLEEVRPGHKPQSATSLAFSREDDLLASGGTDQQLVLWQVMWDGADATISRLPSPFYQTQPILAIAFGPETLVATDGDSSVCFYDVDARRLVGDTKCLTGHRTGAINAVQFVHNATRLVTAGFGNPIVEWDSLLWSQSNDDQTSLEARVCELAGRNLTPTQWDEVFAGTELGGDPDETCD